LGIAYMTNTGVKFECFDKKIFEGFRRA
jgi:hypothetical protein